MCCSVLCGGVDTYVCQHDGCTCDCVCECVCTMHVNVYACVCVMWLCRFARLCA